MKKWRVKKLSTALRQSLDDLKRCERSEKYTVDMGNWHRPNGKCAVCLAGSRMVGLGAKHGEFLEPFGQDNCSKGATAVRDEQAAAMLRAMDDLREGYVHRALKEIGSKHRIRIGYSLDRRHPDYDDGKAWWRAMRKLQRDLEKAGL